MSQVKEHELPPCVGNPGVACRGDLHTLRIKGFDDQYRCLNCNSVHNALVEKEAGNSPLGATPRFVSARLDAKATRASAERERRIQRLSGALKSRGLMGDATRTERIKSTPSPPIDTMSEVVLSESDEERRERIVLRCRDSIR